MPQQTEALCALFDEMLAKWTEDRRFMIMEAAVSSEEADRWEAEDEAERDAYRARLKEILAKW